MPKKTKKAKLIAEYRRKLQRLEVAGEAMPQLPSREVFTLPVAQPPLQTVTTTSMETTEATAIKKELIKTLGIVSLFLVFEFVLARFMR